MWGSGFRKESESGVTDPVRPEMVTVDVNMFGTWFGGEG